jgi:hypothetical protein
MAEILTKLSSDFKSNTILGFCIALILYVANGIRISLGNSLINDWPLTELLINYQGGFVRRGIFGEIVFNTANPITSTTLLQKFALIFCLIGLIGILIYQSSNLVRIIFTTIVVFAPGGLHDMKAGGDFPGGQWEYLDRKEIWFYSALIIFYFSVKWFSNRPVLLTGIFTTISVIMILHHELFVFFALILFTVLLISKRTKLRSKEGLLAGVFYFFVSITFYMVYRFHGDGEIAYIIWYSYQDKYSEIVKHFGAIESINWTIAKSHELALTIISDGSVLFYLFFAAMSVLFLLIYTIVKFKVRVELYLALLLNIGVLFVCALISYVFMDVGRLISIYTFITLFSLNVLYESLRQSEASGTLRFTNKGEVSEEHQKYLILFFVIGYLIFVSLITRVPHCCPQPNEIPLRSAFFGFLK